MNSKAVAAVAVIVVVIVVAGAFLLLNHPAYNSQTTSAATTTASPTTANTNTSVTTSIAGNQSMAELFNNSQYFPYAYLISGNAALSSAGIAATSDFNISTTGLQNGSTMYVLRFKGSGAVYNITMAHGDKLYYIDRNLGDDSATDITTGDDGYAVVNATGYIVALQYPLSGA